MIRRLSIAATAIALAAAGSALAADPEEAAPATPVEKPSAEAVRSFWNFYFNGKGQGVVLADSKLCLEVSKAGPTKSECVKDLPAEGVKPGTVVNVWQAYLVPQNDTVEDVTIQLKLGDQVRETKDVKIPGTSIRYRAWHAFRVPKAGKWTFEIMRGGEVLQSLELTAQ